MNDDWDFYLCEVEGKPASILLDLGAAADAPDARFPRMGYVSVAFRDADANGFPLAQDHEALAGVEDRLVEALTGGGAARYVGRCILDGRMDCIFYAASSLDWEGTVAAALEDCTVLAWESGIHDEADWSTYLEFLYPDPAAMVELQNRRALGRLEDMGDDLEAPRPVEHWLDFPSPGEAEAFWQEAWSRGFLRCDIGEDEDGDGRTRLCLRREDAPAAMDEVSLELFALAAPHGGDYAGWSCAAKAELAEEEDLSPAL